MFTFFARRNSNSDSTSSVVSDFVPNMLYSLDQLDEEFYNREFEVLTKYDRFLNRKFQFSERVFKRYSNIPCPEWSRIHSPLNVKVERDRVTYRMEALQQLKEFLDSGDFDRIIPKRMIPELEEEDIECMHANLILSETINSFLPMYNIQTDYIVGHAPLTQEFSRFYHCIIHHKISLVVVLEKAVQKRKMDKWWPDTQEPVIYDEMQSSKLELLSEDNFGSYTVRKLRGTVENVSFDFTQIHFEKWPDFGIPHLGQFSQLISTIVTELDQCETRKVFVHCSAGIGRTSTLVSSLILREQADRYLSQGNDNFTIQLPLLVRVLKYHRPGMTQTTPQYMFPSNYIRMYIEQQYGNHIKILHKGLNAMV